MNYILRTTFMSLLGLTLVWAGQRGVSGPRLVYDAQVTSQGNQTKFVVTFTNRGKEPITDLKIDRVGLMGFQRTYNPPFNAPTIRPGKAYTFNVTLRGTLVTTARDEAIIVDARYTVGREKIQIIGRIPLCPDGN